MPIREPATFSWPGPWFALLRPPACAWSRSARRPGSPGTRSAATSGSSRCESGFLIAPTDVAQWQAESALRLTATSGRIEALALAADAEQPVVARRPGDGGRRPRTRGRSLLRRRRHLLERARARPRPHARRGRGSGRVGRDARGGTPERRHARHRPERSRRSALHRRRRRVPRPAALRALRPPRASLAPGLLRRLVHRGGLRADVVSGGVIRVGDPLRLIP